MSLEMRASNQLDAPSLIVIHPYLETSAEIAAERIKNQAENKSIYSRTANTPKNYSKFSSKSPRQIRTAPHNNLHQKISSPEAETQQYDPIIRESLVALVKKPVAEVL